jgi:predicted O-methyltransferase YrrM
MFTCTIHSRNPAVLEIGSYLGFSAAIWSHAVGPSGTVTGLEFNPEYASVAESKLSGLGINNVNFIVGAAADSLSTLSPEVPYDLVFIDADKANYPTYLALLLSRSQPEAPTRILRPGALIVADNVLRRGIVADPSDANPHVKVDRERTAQGKNGEHRSNRDLEMLDRFNKDISESDRVETWLVPLWDGVMVGRLID